MATYSSILGCSPPDSSVHGDSPSKNTKVSSLSLLQGIFLTQESNQGLLHYRWILYQLSYEGTPVTQVVKNPPAMQETLVGFLGQEDPLEEGMAAYSSILAWRIPMDR